MREEAKARLGCMVGRFVDFGLLAVLLISPIQYSVRVGGIAHVSPVDPLVWLVFAAWLARVFLSKDASWRQCAPPAEIILFVALCALSAVKAANIVETAREVIQLIEYLVAAFVLFKAAATDERRARACVAAFLAGASMVLFLAFAQYMRPGTPPFKIGGTFGNRNVLGGYLSLVLPFAFGLALYETRWPMRAWLVAVLATGLLVDLSGGSIIGMLVGLGLVCALRGRAVFLGFWAFILCLGAAAASLPGRHTDALAESVCLYTDEGEISRRYVEWQAAGRMIMENPWLGVGMGNYQANVRQYFGTLPNPARAAEPDSQNLYIVLASSAGLPAAFLFMGILLISAAEGGRRYASRKEGFLAVAALGAVGSIVAFSISSVWSPLLVRGIGVPLAFILAMASAPEAAGALQVPPDVCAHPARR